MRLRLWRRGIIRKGHEKKEKSEMSRYLAISAGGGLLCLLCLPGMAWGMGGEGAAASLPAPYMIVPFLLMLLAIAILPLVAEHWWEKNRNRAIVSALLGTPMFLYYAVTDPAALFHTLHEYFSFIVLLWSLFAIAGGIVFRGDLKATPQTNTLFLATGAVLANLIGTTGASMVLIYPLLRTNQERRITLHTFIFFIFIVSNCGGSLLPIGDPPLFLGFLRGVPFFWTLEYLWPDWLFVNGVLLAIYFVWDSVAFTREEVRDIVLDKTRVVPLKLEGRFNLFLLGGVVVSVAFIPTPWREGVMILLGLLSVRFTPKALREANHFSWHAITEVAILFIGIFVTMIPALQILHARGPSFGLTETWQFFWATGLLSSFLDNAPTYLSFTSLASGVVGVDPSHLLALVEHERGMWLLHAISTGAVFMGANTYIGNAPNFMVKSICE
ncbi:MAG: sodium:proton antiporter, partial [Deltaproteobacteria bacterium]